MKDIAVRSAYVASVLLLITGALFKLQHWPYSWEILTGGSVTGTLFVIFAVVEIYKSAKPMWQKIAWTIALIAALLTYMPLYLLVAVAYIQYRRKHIIINRPR